MSRSMVKGGTVMLKAAYEMGLFHGIIVGFVVALGVVLVGALVYKQIKKA